MKEWKSIEPVLDGVISNIVYDIWGGVGISTNYNEDSKEIHLIIWDKSYKVADKKEVVNKRFKFDLKKTSSPMMMLPEITAEIEKYLLSF